MDHVSDRTGKVGSGYRCQAPTCYAIRYGPGVLSVEEVLKISLYNFDHLQL